MTLSEKVEKVSKDKVRLAWHDFLYAKHVKKFLKDVEKDIIKLDKPAKHTVYWTDVLQVIKDKAGKRLLK